MAPPASVPAHHIRTFHFARIGLSLALLLHGLFFVLFALYWIKPLLLLNIASIGIYIFSLLLLQRQGLHLAIVLLAAAEVTIHQIVAVLQLGWGCGFQYYLLTVSVFVLTSPLQRQVWPMLIGSFNVIILIWLFFSGQHLLAPHHVLPPAVQSGLYGLNLVSATALITFFAYVFSSESRRNESMLLRTNQRLQQEILERLQAEKNLQQAKEAAELATRYKSAFVANISHEIRTPLNAILGYAQILQNRPDADQQTRKAIEAIDRSGSHLLSLINDILDLAKIEAGHVDLKREPFDLNQLLHALVEMFELRCREKGLSWKVAGLKQHQEVPVVGDAVKLRQILINLLANAVKFTEQGGIVLAVSANGDRYSFSIADSGPGIPASQRSHIFEPFRKASGPVEKEGSGLGLSISKSFLEMMDSSLEMETSTPGGTRFSFTLTLPAADLYAIAGNQQPQRIRGILADHPLHALVVDDDQFSRSMLSLLLNEYGIRSTESANGDQALAILQKNRPDIIFMDRFMPKMDGIETIARIHAAHGKGAIPIIIITAAALNNDDQILEQAGADGILLKPCDIEDVVRCMASVLGLPLKMEKVTPKPGSQELPHNLKPEEAAIPSDLHARLIEAAEFGRISIFRALIEEVRPHLAGQPRELAALQRHLDSYALDDCLDLLQRMGTIQD